jgi:hypothetical protein
LPGRIGVVEGASRSGLDLGIGSRGWAVTRHDGGDRDSGGAILALGTRPFDAPETDKGRTPPNRLRRAARGTSCGCSSSTCRSGPRPNAAPPRGFRAFLKRDGHLERFPIRWHHLIDKKSLKIKYLSIVVPIEPVRSDRAML